MKQKSFTCCICGKTFHGWGNNPWPILEDGECCDKCNEKVVAYRILRLGLMRGGV